MHGPARIWAHEFDLQGVRAENARLRGKTVSDKPKKAPPRPLAYDDEMLGRLCQRVYRMRLGKGAIERMTAEHGEDKLKRWAMAYAPIVKCTLNAMNEEENNNG